MGRIAVEAALLRRLRDNLGLTGGKVDEYCLQPSVFREQLWREATGDWM